MDAYKIGKDIANLQHRVRELEEIIHAMMTADNQQKGKDKEEGIEA